jgi:hypothetical protein
LLDVGGSRANPSPLRFIHLAGVTHFDERLEIRRQSRLHQLFPLALGVEL